MRKTLAAGAVLVVLALTYWMWPLLGAEQIAGVATNGEPIQIMQYIDLPALRHSIGSQIVHAYLEQNPKYQQLGSLGRTLVGSVGASVADAMMQEAMTPDNLAALLKQGLMTDGKTSTVRPNETLWTMPPLARAFESGLFRAFLHSHFDGPISFVLVLDNEADVYGVHLHLVGARWLISGLDLPKQVCDRLAREIAAKQETMGAT